MITEHACFKAPRDPDIRMWRYFDLPKFLSLIQSQALFFPRSDLLGDPYEGAFTEANTALWEAAVRDEDVRKKVYGPDVSAEVAQRLSDEYRAGIRYLRPRMFISCWHASQYESAAMWSQYAQAGQAIAVQTTFKALADALPPCAMMGLVEYLDYSKDIINWGNTFNLFLRKRRSFEHEKEVRAIVWKPNDEAEAPDGLTYSEGGALVPVNLTSFIQTIYVGPVAPAWFVHVIEDVVRRYGLEVPVLQSDLMSPPVR